MIIKACSTATKRECVDIYDVLNHIEEDHVQINELINQVKKSPRLSDEDKRFYQKELLTMAKVLYEVEDYSLVVDRTYGNFFGEGGYSYERLRVSKSEKTVVNETSFTIVSYGQENDWVAYVDLPIDVVL